MNDNNVPPEVRHHYQADMFSGSYVCIYCKHEICEGPEQSKQLAHHLYQRVCRHKDRRIMIERRVRRCRTST